MRSFIVQQGSAILLC